LAAQVASRSPSHAGKPAAQTSTLHATGSSASLQNWVLEQASVSAAPVPNELIS
jgi:hypothetical protein